MFSRSCSAQSSATRKLLIAATCVNGRLFVQVVLTRTQFAAQVRVRISNHVRSKYWVRKAGML
jgi:hypothetical protein